MTSLLLEVNNLHGRWPPSSYQTAFKMARSINVVTLLFWIVLAVAHPHSVPCEKVDKYSTQWFLDHALADFKKPFSDDALFYTRGMTSQAIKYAKSCNLITLWNVWPCELYNYHNTPDNSMRCIHNEESLRTIFYENMSRAFAMKANGSAIVMHSLKDYDNPPLNGIWGRIELPTIKKVAKVDLLAKIKETGDGYLLFWWLHYEAVTAWLKQQRPLSIHEELKGLKRRDLQAPTYCIRPEDYRFFDNVDW